jgi:hypothetical protein
MFISALPFLHIFFQNGTSRLIFLIIMAAIGAIAIHIFEKHIVITFSVGLQQIYVNGVLSASSTSTLMPIVSGGSGTFQVGCNQNGTTHFLNSGSRVDDLRFYNVVLTAAQVSELYTGRVSVYYNATGDSGMNINYNSNKII